MKRLLPWLLLCAAGVSPAGAAEAPRVTAALSTNNIHIGDVVTLKVHVDHPAGARAQLPDFGREKRVVVRDQKAAAAEKGGTDFTVVLTSLTPGSHVVSTGVVSALLADGTTVAAPFPDLTLRVQSLIAETNQVLAGIKPPVRWKRPLPWQLAWMIPLGLLVVALAAYALRRLLRRVKAPAPPPPPIPPHERALRELAELLARQWIEQRNVEPFYVALSGIVRRYIEDRFHLRAPEQTTEEFIRAAANSAALSYDHRQLTTSFLEQCDLVKFARHQPGEADMRAAHDAAGRLVRETIPTTMDLTRRSATAAAETLSGVTRQP